MEEMPPVLLGVSLLIPFALALVLHRLFESRLVVSHPLMVQPRKQFFLELIMCLAAGAVVVILPVLIVFMFLQRYIVAGLTQGAVK